MAALAGQPVREESPDSQKIRCRVTPGRGNPTDSATEKKPPAFGSGRVKRWGKSPPPGWQQTGHGKPHREQCQIGIAWAARPGAASAPAGPGWQLEGCWQQHLERNGHLGAGNRPRQNPAYSPSAHFPFPHHPPGGMAALRALPPIRSAFRIGGSQTRGPCRWP